MESISPAEPACTPSVSAGSIETLPDRMTTGMICAWLAGMVAGAIIHLHEADLRLAHPGLLLPACLLLMWPTRIVFLVQIQAVLVAYVTWLLLSAGFEISWRWPLPTNGAVYVSSTLPAAALLLIGSLLNAFQRTDKPRTSPFPAKALVGAVIVLALHMYVLFVLLRSAYGFGWEENAAVLGRVGLLIIVIVGASPMARCFALRSSLGLMVALVLLARSLSS